MNRSLVPLNTSSLRSLCAVTALGLAATACGGDGTGGPQGPSNRSPQFSSSPETIADHNREWSYRVSATDADGDALTIELIRAPAWLAYDESTRTLSGLAGFENLGTHQVTFSAKDATDETRQNFNLEVIPGEIFCNQDFGDSAGSLYTLPWKVGAEYLLQQGNCNAVGGHVNWFAYDFDLAIGDTIVASRGGEVVAVREQFADGTRICGQQMENLVFVEHDDGTIMSYVHLTTNGAFVEVGDTVDQGDPLGLSGDSGCSAGPHLHVALFAAQRTGFDRQWSLPLNYSNSSGPLDSQNQLTPGNRYLAVP